VHPASRLLASESAHVESEAGEHGLHAFAWRTMDEILLASFMGLHDVLEAEPYDVVVGDEAWDVDHDLHENPELKRTAVAWLTTCLEPTALRRPFLDVPLRHHFEQQIHVPHRLAGSRAGVRLAYEETEPERLASAIADGLQRPVLSAEVETDGARRAAELIGQLL
jgi:hypothetical protein